MMHPKFEVRTISHMHSWGGASMAHDYEMTDGEIVTFTETAAERERIAHKIFNGGRRLWDAYQQGQFARATGQPRDSNPWPHPSLPGHVNIAEWYRGWDTGI